MPNLRVLDFQKVKLKEKLEAKKMFSGQSAESLQKTLVLGKSDLSSVEKEKEKEEETKFNKLAILGVFLECTHLLGSDQKR